MSSIQSNSASNKELLLDELGITLNFNELQSAKIYAIARDKYFRIPSWLRWAFPSRRKLYQKQSSQIRIEYFNATIDKMEKLI